MRHMGAMFCMSNGMIIYDSFYEATKEFDDKEFREVWTCIFEYGLYNIELDATGNPKVVFTLVKPQIDANNKRKDSASKGGRPTNKPMVVEEETNGYENKKPMVIKMETIGYETENHRLENEKPKVKVKEKEKEKVKEKVKEKEKSAYGTYANVMLTQAEYDKLHVDYTNADMLIDFLSKYIVEKEYRSKSHYLSIRRWVVDAVSERNYKHAPMPKYAKADAQTEELLKDLPFGND